MISTSVIFSLELWLLKTSWFDSIYLIRLGNVLLAINSVVVIYFFAKRFLNIRSNNLYWILFFIDFNGMIPWTVIRNLNDTLFVYVLVLFSYLLFELILKNKLNTFQIVILEMSFYVLIILLIVSIFAVSLLKQKRYLLYYSSHFYISDYYSFYW